MGPGSMRGGALICSIVVIVTHALFLDVVLGWGTFLSVYKRVGATLVVHFESGAPRRSAVLVVLYPFVSRGC